jgi:para-nitrobenzyl esterase
MLGTNRDENKTFLMPQERFVKRFTPLYMRLRDPPRYNALAEAMSTSWKILGADAPAEALARSGAEVYVYRFDWDEEPTLLGADLSQILGAGHGLEIPFVFGHFDLGRRANVIFTDDNEQGRQELSTAMRAYWAAFARDGKPGNGGGRAPASWPVFGGSQERLVFDTVQDGGIRAARGTSSRQELLASIDADKRLRTPKERCAVMREVARFSGLLTAAEYPALSGGACKEFPFDREPY